MLILVEGPRNCGKSYLIGESGFNSYKFPFVDYFKKFIAKEEKDTGKGSRETFQLSAGNNLTILSLNAGGFLTSVPMVIDRGFLSDIVLGIMQERITEAEGYKYIDYLVDNKYLKSVRVIYVDKNNKENGRSTEDGNKKDNWEFLEYDKQSELFKKLIGYLASEHGVSCTKFINKFNESSTKKFQELLIRCLGGNFIDKVLEIFS